LIPKQSLSPIGDRLPIESQDVPKYMTIMLAIDIGNTNINIGVFKGSRLLNRFLIPTKDIPYFAHLKRITSRYKADNAIVCSVVPSVTRKIEKDLKKLLGKAPYIIGKNIKVPIKNLYRRPEQVGQDRLVNAYAGIKFYGVPLIVVDFGTAITFDIISKKKEYLGGMILPGLQISLQILHEKTALLPEITAGRPEEFIGKDTKNSMLSGITYGYVLLTEALIREISRKEKKNFKVVLTGGNAELIADFCKKRYIIDCDLTLKGLNQLQLSLKEEV
jgi:type III pantothenate kinase